MFTSFRRKPKFEDDFGTGATVASSPATLPQLGTAQGALQWPESLIDVSTVQGTNSNTTGLPQDTSPKRPGGASARKASFSKGDGRGPIPFHKPFRTPDGPISSLYTSTFAMKVPVTPSLDGAGEEKPKAGLVGKGAPRRFATQKRPRPPPNTFNIMVRNTSCKNFAPFMTLMSGGTLRSQEANQRAKPRFSDCCLTRQSSPLEPQRTRRRPLSAFYAVQRRRRRRRLRRRVSRRPIRDTSMCCCPSWILQAWIMRRVAS